MRFSPLCGVGREAAGLVGLGQLAHKHAGGPAVKHQVAGHEVQHHAAIGQGVAGLVPGCGTSGGTGEGMPTCEVARAKIDAGYPIADALVAAKLAESKSEARRAIQQKAVKLNGDAVTDEKLAVTEAALDPEGVARLSVGKKRHARLKAV